MKLRMNSLLAGATVLAALTATAASAATIIKAVPNGPFSLNNPLAGLPATKLFKANTYDFTFSMVQPINGTVATVQIQAQAQLSGVNENITFDLYSGVPSTGVKLATSSTGTNANLAFNPSVGPYYIQITPNYIAANKEALSGTILVSPIPEPAAWILMLVGFGGLGVALRRRGAMAEAV